MGVRVRWGFVVECMSGWLGRHLGWWAGLSGHLSSTRKETREYWTELIDADEGKVFIAGPHGLLKYSQTVQITYA